MSESAYDYLMRISRNGINDSHETESPKTPYRFPTGSTSEESQNKASGECSISHLPPFIRNIIRGR